MEHPTQVETTQSAPLVISADVILRRCDGDRELLASLIEMFPEESRKILQNLELAWASKDVAGVQLHAHSLKGMCNTFEARDAANAAFQLEQTAQQGSLGSEQQLQFLKNELDRAMDAVAHLEGMSH